MRTITKSSQIHYIADLICLNNNSCRSRKLTVIIFKKSVDSSLFKGKKQSLTSWEEQCNRKTPVASTNRINTTVVNILSDGTSA